MPAKPPPLPPRPSAGDASAPLHIEEPPPGAGAGAGPGAAGGPRKRRRSKLITTLLLVVGFPVAVLSALLSWGMLYSWTAKTLPVSEADKAALFTAADLSPFIVEQEVDSSLEVFEKLRYMDRSIELSYEFDDADITGIYVLSGLQIESTRQDAAAAYTGMKSASSLISLGLGTEKRDDLLAWGDASECILLSNDEGPVGHWFMARKDKRVYSLMIIGLHLSEGQMFRNLLVPRLEEMEAHRVNDQ